MKNIFIADTTLCRSADSLNFKEKIEIARLSERMMVDSVELPRVENTKAEMLLLRTLASFLKHAELSVCVGLNAADIPVITEAIAAAAKPVLRVELPTSPVGMEYTCHRKPPKMLALITELVTAAKAACDTVEFCALDATRAETDFLKSAICAAVEAGASRVTLCDDAAVLLPDEIAAFVERTRQNTCPDVPFGILCTDKNGMANAAAVLSVKTGADRIKTAVTPGTVDLETLAGFLKDHSTDYSCRLCMTEINRTVKQIARLCSATAAEPGSGSEENTVRLDRADTREAVQSAVAGLGYDLSEEDIDKVYTEFKKLAEKKTVGARELDAIVAATAAQVPETYKLVNYVVNSGNVIPASAQIRLSENGVESDGVQIGDGPIDAAFRAIEQLIGRHYELDDFKIQTVTEGREAMGSAIVKLRVGGRVFSGNGISTDIIEASIRAYLVAVNKIVYEEA